MKPTLTTKQLQKTFALQQDQSDCGVACLLSAIQYYKGNNSLEKLRELSGTTKAGTTLLGLYQAANQLNFKANGCEADLQALIDHRSPVILHVLMEERLQHYVICYGFENDTFIIGDPAKGIITYTKEELSVIWKSKSCLTLTPNKNFVVTENLKKSKKEWFLKLLKDDYTLLINSIVIGIAVAGLGMAMSVFSQKLIDDILPSKDLKRLVTGIALLSFLLIVRVGFSSLREFFLIRQSKDFNNRIINNFYGSLLQLPKPFFDSRKIGELVARLNDTSRIQRVIKHIASNFIIDTLMVLISLGFLFYYSWETGVIAAICLPVYFLLVYRFNKRIIEAQKQVMQGYAYNESNYISSMQSIATIKNFNRQSVFQKINKLIYGAFQDNVFNLGKINVRLALLTGLSGVLFLMAILSFSSYQVYQSTMELGELMAVLGIAGSLLPSITNLALISIPINEAKIAFNRMFEFAAIEKETSGNKVIKTFETLSLKNLSFRFAGRKQLLKNINIELQKNECIAIIGESGCGKSTLGQILQKFYFLENGSIVINRKTSLEEINTQSWREIIGVVPQDISIFNGTALDNILLGKEDTPENIISFFKHYGLDKFIDNLPQGMATILGEEGINLSGGQKQLIALARVLYKKPQVLLLDEFSSAMDRKTEQFTLELLNNLKKELSIVFISHRLHSLKKIADRIYIIKNGTCITSGTHHELLKTPNFYSEYWQELAIV